MSTASSLALLRIEMKLDVLLSFLRGQYSQVDAVLQKIGPTLLLNGAADRCAICGAQIRIAIDPATEEYVRSCACRPPVSVVLGISKLLEPQKPTDGRKSEQEEEHSDAEDPNPSTGRSQDLPVHLL